MVDRSKLTVESWLEFEEHLREEDTRLDAGDHALWLSTSDSIVACFREIGPRVIDELLGRAPIFLRAVRVRFGELAAAAKRGDAQARATAIVLLDAAGEASVGACLAENDLIEFVQALAGAHEHSSDELPLGIAWAFEQHEAAAWAVTELYIQALHILAYLRGGCEVLRPIVTKLRPDPEHITLVLWRGTADLLGFRYAFQGVPATARVTLEEDTLERLWASVCRASLKVTPSRQ